MIDAVNELLKSPLIWIFLFWLAVGLVVGRKI